MDEILSPIERKDKLSAQVAAKIKELILSGRIEPGKKLPTERELGETFQVSRTVIREAITALEARGLVESQTGSGTYVRALSAEDVSDSLGLFLTTQDQEFTFESMMEVRQVLEIQIARLVAERATEENIHKLENILKNMCATAGDIDKFSDWDFEFHMTLSEACGNPLFCVMLEPLTDILFDFIWTGSSATGATQEACNFHKEILDRIKAKDPNGASEAMRAHLEQSQRVTHEGLKKLRKH